MIRNRHIFAFFFVSGFTALIFEVVWAKQACLIFGNTTLASAAVIAAFMTGLALGSHFFGKLADARPEKGLIFYAMLEGGVAIFALFFPLIIRVLDPVYRGIYVSFHDDFFKVSMIRFFLSFLVLVVPTALMGGTLPFLSRFLSRDGSDIKAPLSQLYAMNLFGAMSGTFASGFLLIAFLGLHGTSIFAALLNLGILIFVLVDGRRRGTLDIPVAAPGPAVAEGDTPALSRRDTLLIFFLMLSHGFTAFVVQICWTRTTGLVLGSSTYAFSAMLTTFLAGLGLGSFAVGKASARGVRFTPKLLGYLEMLVGLAVVSFIPAFEWIVYYFVKAFPYIRGSVTMVFATQFILSAIAMIVPAFLMGTVFPAALACLGGSRNIGKTVGRTYALNTLGGVVGAFTAAFFFISKAGLGGSLHIASLVALTTGLVLIIGASGGWRPIDTRKTALVLVPSLLFMFYPWDRNLFSSGVFIYASSWAEYAHHGKAQFQKMLGSAHRLIYYKDGMSSTVAVLEYEGVSPNGRKVNSKSIRVNGKTDASTVGDMATQLYLGYIPLFAHPRPEDVLVIGMGSGVTLGTVTQFDTVKTIECAEIEPAVVEANKFFSAENNYALKDPRVKIVIGDGRNHIRYSPKQYDVIISEPSNPWISGISSLFSKENYEEAIQRLRPNGIYCQWFHAYQMSKDDFVMIMRTFASVFPEVSLHKVGGSDYFLLGSRQEIMYSYSDMMRRIRQNRTIASDLKHFTDHEENFVLGSFILSGRDLRLALQSEPVRFNTDDRLALEYNAPKFLYTETSDDIRRWINRVTRLDYFPRYRDRSVDDILTSGSIWKIFSANATDAFAAENYPAAQMYLQKAIKLSPGNPQVRFQLGLLYDARKEYRRSIRHYAAIRNIPEWGIRAGSGLRRAYLLKAVEENPILRRNVETANAIASLSFFMGQAEDAMKRISEATDIDPSFPKNYADMAVYLTVLGYPGEGANILEKAKLMAPEDPFVIEAARMLSGASELTAVLPADETGGIAGEGLSSARAKMKAGLDLLRAKDFPAAENFFSAAVSENDQDPLAYFFLSQSEAANGKADLAAKHFEMAMTMGLKVPPGSQLEQKILKEKSEYDESVEPLPAE